MIDYFIYFCMVWLGYVSGYLLGWVAGSSFEKTVPKSIPVPKKEGLTSYSHLRRYGRLPSSNALEKDLYPKIYDVKVQDDEYKINKII